MLRPIVRVEGDADVQHEVKPVGCIKWMLFLIAALVMSLPGAASAASRQAQERLAKKACLAGDLAKGVEILAELYVDTNDITFIFNQGRCFEQNRKYEDAIGRFREYLVKGEKLTAEEKAVAQKRIEACESYLPKSNADRLARK